MMPFFAESDTIDVISLKPLAHIRGNWQIVWDSANRQYQVEEDSFAAVLNGIIFDLDAATPPTRYHDNKDRLAEYVKAHLGWPIHKQGHRWVGADYTQILAQGGFEDVDQLDLLQAAAGRVRAAIQRGQHHFDAMEESHQAMLGAVITVIRYDRM